MKRFALMFNQIGNRVGYVPFLKNNFDFILFKADVEELNDYELIYVYAMSGARKYLFKHYCKWWSYPKYLRQHGITKPKIIWQIDSNGYSFDEFPHPEILGYIDAVLHVGHKEWTIPKPYFCVQYPLKHPENPKSWWVSWEDKELAAVTVKRHASMFYPAERTAGRLGIKLHCLGWKIKKKFDSDYLKYLANHKIAIDASDHYYSWSKFVAECAYMGTPVLALPTIKAATIANPVLVGKEDKLMALGRKLLTDKEFYEECRLTAYKNIDRYLSPKACDERYKAILRKIGIEV